MPTSPGIEPWPRGEDDERQPPRVSRAPAEILADLDERLARIEARLGRVDGIAHEARALVATAGDTFDRFAEDHELYERALAASRLLERLSEPQVLARLRSLLDLAEGVPPLLATAGDVLDSVADEAERRGVELGELAPRLSELLTAGARALTRPPPSPSSEPGMLGLYRALREPEVRRTLGLALDLARDLGRRVPPPAGESEHA